MIITELIGGLGNQLFQYAAAYSLAKRFKTALALDINWYEHNLDRLFVLKNFNIKGEIIETPKVDFLTRNRLLKVTAKYLPFLNYHHITLNDPVWEKINIEKYGKNIYMRGYWAFADYFLSDINDLKDLFTLKQEVLTEAYRECDYFLSDKECIAVHIRRGDYELANNQDFFGLLDLEYYYSAFNIILKKTSDPFFLFFSDNTEWVKENINTPPNSVFMSDWNLNEDFLELGIMAKCKHNIIANSTFSWWAAMLNNNPAKIVIQPKKWYINPKAQALYETKQILHIENSLRI